MYPNIDQTMASLLSANLIILILIRNKWFQMFSKKIKKLYGCGSNQQASDHKTFILNIHLSF